MPSADYAPRPMLMAACDLRPWSNTTLFSGPSPVTLPTYSAAAQGVFRDTLDALCGRGSYVGEDLAARATAAWTGGGAPAFTAGIDSDDHVWLEADLQFTVGALVQWGFTAPTAAVAVGARWRATADADWARGNISGPLSITPAGGGAAYTAPRTSRYHAIPVAIRASSLAGFDSVPYLDTIQAADCAANHVSIRWGIDSTGRVYRAWTQASGPVAPVWASLSAMERFGFTGSEPITTIAGISRVTAEHPCPGVLAPSRPLAEPVVPWSEVEADTVRTQGGRVYRVERALTHGWTAAVDLDGPLDAGDPLWEHYRRRWLPYQADGVTLYLDAGDPRRRGDEQSGAIYGLIYTVQGDGYGHGRIVGTLAESHQTSTELRGRAAGLYRQGPLTFRMAENP